MAEIFNAFGYQFEILNKKEVALVAADDARGRFVIPNKISYEGKDYIVTQVGGYRKYQTITSHEGQDPADRRRKITIYEHPYRYGHGQTIFNGEIEKTNYHQQVTDVIVPDSVKKLEPHCFTPWYSTTSNDDTKLKTLKLSKNITQIPKGMCQSCINLEVVDLPCIEIIGAWAFSGCRKLKKIKLPVTLKHIENYAFANCESLTSIKIPSSIESIGNGAFSNCKKLKTVTIDSKEGNVLIAEDAFPETCKIKYTADSFWGKLKKIF